MCVCECVCVYDLPCQLSKDCALKKDFLQLPYALCVHKYSTSPLISFHSEMSTFISEIFLLCGSLEFSRVSMLLNFEL